MGRCGSCNRPLRNARSIDLGYGPGCWARLDFAEREAVRARRHVVGHEAEPARPTPAVAVPATPTTPPPEPAPPQRSDSPLAVIASWVVGIALVLALALFWQWLLLAAGLLAATAATGLAVERLQERRLATGRRPTPGPARLAHPLTPEVDGAATSARARPGPTMPSGAA